MNLGAALEIYGGGPGSGCHGPNCGRPEGPHSVSTEERFRDAKTGEWTPERQAFHQSIVDAAVAGKEPAEGRRPIAYVMGGGTASGKTTASERVIGKNPGAVRVDPDEIKFKIPEFADYKKAEPKTASAMVHEESSYITKKVMAETIARGLDLTYDATTSGK